MFKILYYEKLIVLKNYTVILKLLLIIFKKNFSATTYI